MDGEAAREFSSGESRDQSVARSPPGRFRDLPLRCLTGCALFLGLLGLSLLGPAYLTLLVLALQLCAYWELSALRRDVDARARLVCWALYLVGVLFLYAHGFRDLSVEWRPLALLVAHRRALLAPLYALLFVAFVLALREPLLRAQLWLWVVTHAALIVAAAFSLSTPIVYQGAGWWLMSVAQVCTNDAGGLLFGRLFGRRRLLAFTPRKTREGFAGAALTTLACTLLFALIARLPRFAFWGCARATVTFRPLALADCPPDAPFRRGPRGLSAFELHSLACALFAAFGAPFTGLLSSAVKRSLRAKHYSRLLPGHGGMLDRFDCQLLMNVFLYCYLLGGLYRAEQGLARAEGLARALPPAQLLALAERLRG